MRGEPLLSPIGFTPNCQRLVCRFCGTSPSHRAYGRGPAGKKHEAPAAREVEI